ncbi:MAG: hypothetical protein ACRDQU_09905 [Pseudonocardiaceae bacterium]
MRCARACESWPCFSSWPGSSAELLTELRTQVRNSVLSWGNTLYGT